MMKYLLASLFLFSSAVFGQTVIHYNDGSTYTLENGEFVVVANHNVFAKTTYTTGGVHFRPLKPNAKRDFVPAETDGMEPGSDEWCETYVPFQNGYTFDDQMWQRACQG
jgi:hypothetical protein